MSAKKGSASSLASKPKAAPDSVSPQQGTTANAGSRLSPGMRNGPHLPGGSVPAGRYSPA